MTHAILVVLKAMGFMSGRDPRNLGGAEGYGPMSGRDPRKVGLKVMVLLQLCLRQPLASPH